MWSILLIWNDNVKDKDTQFIWNTWISVKITIELFISDSSVKRICNVCKVSNFIETKEMTCCCCIVFYLVYIFNSFKQYVNLFSTLSFLIYRHYVFPHSGPNIHMSYLSENELFVYIISNILVRISKVTR